MNRNQILITVGAVAAALAIGIVVTLVVTNGDDTDEISTSGTRPTQPATTAPPATTPPSTVAPTTPATGPPTTPPTVVVVPPVTVAPTSPPTVPPTTPPTTQPTIPPTTTPPPPSDPGITDTEIRLAVIADSQESVQGVQAWANTVNKKGLAGRKVVLDPFIVNGDPNQYAAAVDTACEQDFAIVGSLSTGDASLGNLIDCGIPNLPARALSTANRGAPNTFAVVPTAETRFQVGGFRWLQDTQSACCKQYVVWSTNTALANATKASAQAAVDSAGFTDAGGAALPDNAGRGDFAPSVTEMKADDATFGRSDLPFPTTIAFRTEAAAQDLEDVTWFCLAQCYQTPFLQQGGAAVEDQFVQIGITPFEDAGSVPAVKKYLAAGGPRTQAGVESAAAGLLLQNAVNQVSGGGKDPATVTRKAVLSTVSGISAFNAGGLIGTTDVGDRVPNGCFVMMKVDGGKFVRAQPTSAGQLNCDPGNLTASLGP